ncbi:MAG TPA: hypothetical protein PLD23_09510 [Armatimonadota bacterium]|nr:hypothetical protein [Armatimonadota bacterium]
MARAVRRRGNRVWIDGVPILGFGRGIECAYIGALAAALSVTDHPSPYAELMGFSGLAFRVRWWVSPQEPGNRGWCPSTPVGEFPEEGDAIQRNTGWRFRPIARFTHPGGPHMEELIPDIVASIDAGIPVLAYPSIHNLNMGTIYGYDDGGVVWLLRDYFSVDGMTLVPAPDLGPVVLIPTHWEPPPPRRKALLDSIAMALRHWARRRGPDPDGPCFYGADALGQWAADLALVDDPGGGVTEDERNNLFFVSWWNFCALEDARSAAVSFLEAAAADLSADATQHVSQRPKLMGARSQPSAPLSPAPTPSSGPGPARPSPIGPPLSALVNASSSPAPRPSKPKPSNTCGVRPRRPARPHHNQARAQETLPPASKQPTTDQLRGCDPWSGMTSHASASARPSCTTSPTTWP